MIDINNVQNLLYDSIVIKYLIFYQSVIEKSN